MDVKNNNYRPYIQKFHYKIPFTIFPEYESILQVFTVRCAYRQCFFRQHSIITLKVRVYFACWRSETGL